MTQEIEIAVECQNHGHWIRIFVPYSCAGNMFATIAAEAGEMKKRVRLEKGHNAIDISNFNTRLINLNIETPYESILKKINITGN